MFSVVFFFQISCVLMAVFGVIMYRIIVVTILYASSNDIIRENAKLTTSTTAACINLVAILILNRVRFGFNSLWSRDSISMA